MQQQQPPSDRRGSIQYIGAFLAIGAGVGAALGAAFNQIAMGVALGVALGLVFGAILDSRNQAKK